MGDQGKRSSLDAEKKEVLMSALGEGGISGKGLMGLSAHHLGKIAKKFLKVSKSMTTTDVLARLKKILRGSRASYTHWVSRQPAEISIDPDGATGAGQATVFVSHAWKYPFSLSCEVIGSYAKELMKQANAKHHPGTVAV